MAKACGNIGNTLQLLGDYDEAIKYSLRNLEMSQKANDQVINIIKYYYCIRDMHGHDHDLLTQIT